MRGYIDGGSNRSLIGKTPAFAIGGVQPCEPFEIRGFGANPITCTHMITTKVQVDGKEYEGDIHLVDDKHLEVNEVLLGTKLLCVNGNKLVIGDGECFVLPNTDGDGKSCDKENLQKLIKKYEHCFSDELATIGKCKTTSMQIEVTTVTPVRLRPYQVPFAKQLTVKKLIDELMQNDIITKSTSPYASPIVLVAKPNGEDRLCVDYRSLNQITVKQPFPMPVIDELLAKLSGNKYFTSMDLISGYYQIPVEPNSQKYTAFVTHEGHYQFTRMPFGLVNAPSVFQSLMNDLISSLPPGEVVAYLDDTVIPSTTIKEGLERLERFLQALAKVGLTLRMDKCVFLRERIKFLGHSVSIDGIQPGDNKVNAIKDFPAPQNIHEVRRFIGLTGFFRKFVENYSAISRPLTDLLKTKNNPAFKWGEHQTEAFEELKRRLCSAPVLALYNVNLRHEVHTDASSFGIAGVLLQEDADGKLRPVFYFSRHCTEAESKYSSHELEVLAIVETLERFRFYLIGKSFRVVTDCAAVTTTKTTKQLIPRIARWWLRLQEFDFVLVHRAGVQMSHVDAMSRCPVGRECGVADVSERILRVEINQADWLLTMQQQDPILRRIINVLTGTEHTDDEKQLKTDYIFEQNRLFRKIGADKKWVVPNAVRWRIVKNAHDERGHFALEKTIANVTSNFWFARIRQYVKSYIAACVECAYNRKPTGAIEGQLHVSTTIPIPFRTIHIDHLGPFTKSSTGNLYVLGMADSFSKYTIIKAVKSTNTNSVLKFLKDLSIYFGLPLQIVTDRGTAFTSKSFANFCQEHNVRHIQNAVRTPRANGQIERVNQEINRYLRTTTEDARKWDVNLSTLQWILNSQENKTNGCSPNEVVFRFKLRDCLSNKILAVLQEEADEMVADDAPTFDEIVKRVDTEKAKWKARFDASHRAPKKYEQGDLVLIENIAPATGESRKLEPRYRGPYVVQKVLDKDRYLVGDIDGAQRTQKPFLSVFTTDKLKSWCSLGPEVNEDESEDEDGDEAHTY